MRIPIAPEGWPFIFIAVVITVILGFFIPWWALTVPIILTLFVVAFFRDPARDAPVGEGLLISPADGRIIKIERVREDRILKEDAILVSVFMNVFNVHVNRAPDYAKVTRILYNPGKFINASFDKASLLNEQNMLLMERTDGKRYVVNQIAGLIARRIVCRVKEGTLLSRGERFGIIRFGSRLDVYMPLDSEVEVKIGDKVRAGSTVLARMS